MTRSPKSGGSKTGAPKMGTSKAGAAKPGATKAGGARVPATRTTAAKTAETRTGATRPGATKMAAQNGGHKGGGPRNSNPKINGHANAQAAQPAGPVPRKANKRGAARLAAVQALYQMDMTGAGLNEILAQFESHWLGREVEGEQYLPAEAAFFRDIVSGVVGVQRDLDPRIDAALEATWPLKRIEAILRSVLRAGAYELEKRADIPARVVVSEYVDVANAFVGKTETGMVNAVLERLARNARAGEFG